MGEPPREVEELATARAQARAAKDFALADRLRGQIADAGWTVADVPDGFTLEPLEPRDPLDVNAIRRRARDIVSILDEEPTVDISVQWVVEGWPEDVVRAISAFRSNQGDRAVHYVVADVTATDPDTYGPDVEVVRLEDGTGWAAARNAGLKRSKGRLVFAMDGSVEPTGDVFGPLEETLADPHVGLAGPFGIVTADLREFDEAPGAGDCDAIEGYFMAFRREMLAQAGLFDEKFAWYRTADIEYSFRVKDTGARAVVVPLPATKHEHRMWFNTSPQERARLSKRNYYRFLDRWRDRWDLCVDPKPPEPHDHGPDHRH